MQEQDPAPADEVRHPEPGVHDAVPLQLYHQIIPDFGEAETADRRSRSRSWTRVSVLLPATGLHSRRPLYSGRGESRASSGGADERCRGGGAAPSTGRQTEGQEAKQQESEEEGRSCEASSQTLSPDGQQEQETSCTSTGSKKTRDGVNGNNMEGQSDQ